MTLGCEDCALEATGGLNESAVDDRRLSNATKIALGCEDCALEATGGHERVSLSMTAVERY